jgi:periplasmic protein CpxP/Spy
MRKTSLLLAAFSLLALGSAAHAEEDMKMPAPAKPAAAKPKPGQQHQQGMQHGGGQMHDQMMKDHAANMANMAGMKAKKDPPAQSGMKMGCGDGSGCKDKPMPGMAADKPDAPMPMNGHM